MGLRVIQILYPVLEIAQESVGVEQGFGCFFVKLSFFSQNVQCIAGRPVLKRRIPATANQLEHLCKEFDFADSAPSEFDVVAAFGMQFFLTHDVGANLLVEIANRVDDAEIEITAVNERTDNMSKCLDIFRIACNGARLDPGIAFPFASLDDQILFNHADTGDERTRRAIGAQCHIDPESEAVFGDFR